MLKIIKSVFLVLLLNACVQKDISEKAKSPREIITELINQSKTEKFSDTLAVDVVYATNREKLNPTLNCNDNTYGVKLAGQLSFGICRVSVPKKHATGKIESTIDPRADSHRYFRVMSHKTLDFENFEKQLTKNTSGEVLVFVHGFNVKFQDAVLRASQIAYDLKFQGNILLFSWPAGADEGLFNSALLSKTYNLNKKNADSTVEYAVNLFEILSKLKLKTYVYVHSMGHQIIIPALVQLAQRNEPQKIIDQLILNAPDYDLKQFIDFTPNLLKLNRKITLYCSYNDAAMTASETVNGGARLGACQSVDGIDVINVSEVDNPSFGLGHGYYSSRAILTDVSLLLLGIDAENRLFIRKSEPNSTENYYLRP